MPLLISAGFFLAATAIVLYGGESLRFREGETVHRDIRARVRFELANKKETDNKRDQAKANSPNVYQLKVELCRYGGHWLR